MHDNQDVLAAGDAVEPTNRSCPVAMADQLSEPHGRRLLICHVIFHLGYGGLENGLVNLINNLPAERYEHAIVCLKGADPTFRKRIRRSGTAIYTLGKRQGKDFAVYVRLWQLLRRLRPDIVHTRNLPALDMLFPARLAGCRRLLHSEHGFDMIELDGRNVRYNQLRRFSRLVASHYLTVSREIAMWLEKEIGVPKSHISLVHNGVDTVRFCPGRSGPSALPMGFVPDNGFVVGTVGRLEAVKDQTTLAKAFVHLLRRWPEMRDRFRLVIIGEGCLRPTIEQILRDGAVSDLAWLPGFRDDLPNLYRALDLFVLPSRREGISNTVLEAMATGLPVIATRVGGNPEIVVPGETGVLVAASDPEIMAAAMLNYAEHQELLHLHGTAALRRVKESFSLDAMLSGYSQAYGGLWADFIS